MCLKKLTILSTFFVSAIFLAQNGANVYPFLNIPISARQAALGGDAVSVRDYDVNFAMVNPSLLNIDMEQRIAINYASYLADSKYGTISYAKDLGRGHLISAHAKYMDYGKMPRTDESAQISGEFSAIDAMLGIGYAYQLEEDWTIGGSVGFVTSKIDNYTSMAIIGSGAVTYHFKKNKETLSLVARNFGHQIKTYNGVRERLPFRIDLGYTKILDEFPLAITITAHDLQKFDISSEYNNNGQEVKFGRKVLDHFSFGAELFPEDAFNIRLGYNVKRGNELAITDQRNFSGLSAGFGVKISSFRFDYAHVRYHNASNMNMLGLTMDLVELSGNRR
ncbi:MAG: type IX secretion system protein PorQ [Cruoricaptor ignavus]|nr:type IX secretion system protein PorQ [Cruoricaptor ignavus]